MSIQLIIAEQKSNDLGESKIVELSNETYSGNEVDILLNDMSDIISSVLNTTHNATFIQFLVESNIINSMLVSNINYSIKLEAYTLPAFIQFNKDYPEVINGFISKSDTIIVNLFR